jgi:hypothetical protein
VAMKKIYLILAVLSFAIFVNAQTEGASKLYGYKQVVIPGTVPKKIIEEDGKQTTLEVKQRYNYFIYLVSSGIVTPTEVWINGKVYSVTTVDVSTPVEHQNPAQGNKAKLLVPKTSKKTLQLSLSGAELSKPSSKGKTLAAKNELVVIYKGGKKTYYKTVKKLTELDAAEMQ